jgi:hypothetical protein
MCSPAARTSGGDRAAESVARVAPHSIIYEVASAFAIKRVKGRHVMTDIYDGTEWTDMEIEDLKGFDRARPLASSLSAYRGGPEEINHSVALVARFRVTTAVPPPVAGVGFLYVSTSPLIAMKRF